MSKKAPPEWWLGGGGGKSEGLVYLERGHAQHLGHEDGHHHAVDQGVSKYCHAHHDEGGDGRSPECREPLHGCWLMLVEAKQARTVPVVPLSRVRLLPVDTEISRC